MGAAKNDKHERGNKRTSNAGNRGSVRNADRLASFKSKRPENRGDWGGVLPERLQSVVVGITRLGGAVTFGLSRDGGAYSVTLMLDGERETLWFNGDADLDEELDQVKATLDAMEIIE